jgi:hypothetical protein
MYLEKPKLIVIWDGDSIRDDNILFFVQVREMSKLQQLLALVQNSTYIHPL